MKGHHKDTAPDEGQRISGTESIGSLRTLADTGSAPPCPAEGDFVFVSYSRGDQDIVFLLIESLRAAGVSVWIDKEGIDGASLWAEEIVNAIRNCRAFILMISSRSVQSKNTFRELSLAAHYNLPILPVHLARVEIPPQMEYQLAGIQHINLFDGPTTDAMTAILRALRRAGIEPVRGLERLPADTPSTRVPAVPEPAPTASARVLLTIVDGQMKGREFRFDAHDAFVFGRMPDCHVCLPDDEYVSRHHFILEANPPDVRLRDLGSLNGTLVNGRKHGGREDHESPEEAAARGSAEIDLNDGDRITVGQTVFVVSAEPAMRPAKPMRCGRCGKDVAREAGQARRGDYICEACRRKAMAASPEEPGASAPAEIPGYRIERRIGGGEFEGVYLAARESDGRKVAAKIMFSRVAVEEAARKAFLREVALARSLKHPNVVELFECGSAEGVFFFVMEYCEGGSLADLLARRGGKLPLGEAGPIMLQALDGLAAAHGASMVHRNLKPSNILLARPETVNRELGALNLVVKISDIVLGSSFQKFGFSGMTLTCGAIEIPPYTPREQVMDFKAVNPVSDIWSLGAVFYRILTGALPREVPPGADPMQVILDGSVHSLRSRDPSLPAEVGRVLDRALAVDPADRYQTAEAMRSDLGAVLDALG